MLKNHFKIALRNLLKNKAFSAINISGLALGLTCSILIFLWVKDEYSVDAFHKNGNHIYIVTSQEYVDNEINGSYDTPGLLGEELKKVMPEVQLACNYSWSNYYTFSSGDKKIKQPGNFAGMDFFKIFSYPLLQGTPETALKSPESIAISQKMAASFFGNPEAAINKTLKFENYKELKVTAVFADIANNSSEQFEYLINWDLFVEREPWLKDWNNSGPTTFVQLRSDADPALVESRLQHFIKGYDMKYSEVRLELGLQRYHEKYLHSNFKNGYISGGRIEYVRLFSIVAIFILLIACINFMNLSTARSIKRAKEVGVRKVIGAVRPALMWQFLCAALLFTLFAVLISVILLVVLLPVFNNLTGKQIVLPFDDYPFWMMMIALTIITGCVAGSYPALLLSSFKPIAVLKNNLKLTPASGWFRKGLVVFQFTLSIIFIVGMIIISKQVNYIQTKNLGYHKNNLIYFPLTGLGANYNLFKNEALKLPGIKEVSKMSNRPVQIENTTGGVEWEGKTPGTRPNFTQVAVSYDFVKAMQAQILQGRDFSENFADSANYLINESALKKIGYKDPIDKPLTFWATKGTIVGVLKDFHFNSLHVPINPLIIRLAGKQSEGTALIRSEPGKTQVALTGLEKLYQELNPEFPFSYQFADEEYGFLYKSEQLVQRLSGYFAFLAIFISCLGLLGLVLFTAEQRIKEIGIRKVLGASVPSLFGLLAKDFFVLILIAFVIATPLAWWVMVKWLDNFSYRTPVSWTVFALAGISALVIALLTISFQSFKSAIANPIKSLRIE
jgi:ABC-type antimicrobial peptide transport system permease subunit